MTPAEILTTGARLVTGERRRTHGDATENMGNLACLLNGYLEARFGAPSSLGAGDAAAIMMLAKLARTMTGTHNVDDYVDGAAYLAIMGACRE